MPYGKGTYGGAVGRPKKKKKGKKPLKSDMKVGKALVVDKKVN